MKKSFWTFLLIAVMIFVTACGSNPSAAEPKAETKDASKDATAKKDQPLTKVKIGYDGFSMTTGPLNYAYEKGIFKKYGLDVELVFINGGSTLTQTIIGGGVDIAQNGYTPSEEAIVSGADLVLIGGISNKLPFQMVVKNSITTVEQLKGKKIAISKFGSSTDQAAEIAIGSLGMKRTDVALLQLGGSGERVAAALSGNIDGSIEQYPQTGQLLKQGFRVMVDLTDIAGEYPNTAYVVKRDYAKKNPEVLKNFFKGISEGIKEYKNNKDEAIKITAKFLKMDNPDELKETYDFYATKIYPDIPRPSLKGIELVLKDIAKEKPNAAQIKPEQIMDISAIEALEKEGFFQNLK
jgi:NitT/TauT family transport system substrate-binding protein